MLARGLNSPQTSVPSAIKRENRSLCLARVSEQFEDKSKSSPEPMGLILSKTMTQKELTCFHLPRTGGQGGQGDLAQALRQLSEMLKPEMGTNN